MNRIPSPNSSWREVCRIWVPGIPKPGGSKKAFIINGRANIVDDCKRNGDWKRSVSFFAHQRWIEPGMKPFNETLQVHFTFVMPRPKAHYGTGKKSGILKENAPAYHTSKPDCTKLIRSTEDALTGIVWSDDSRIAAQSGNKYYGEQPGAQIVVSVLENSPLPPAPSLLQIGGAGILGGAKC